MVFHYRNVFVTAKRKVIKMTFIAISIENDMLQYISNIFGKIHSCTQFNFFFLTLVKTACVNGKENCSIDVISIVRDYLLYKCE